jgi:aspartokinase
MKIVKFGGKSLANGKNHRLDIIERKIKQEEKIAIVVSARMDELDDILIIAAKNRITNTLKFKSYQDGLKALIFD